MPEQKPEYDLERAWNDNKQDLIDYVNSSCKLRKYSMNKHININLTSLLMKAIKNEIIGLVDVIIDAFIKFSYLNKLASTVDDSKYSCLSLMCKNKNMESQTIKLIGLVNRASKRVSILNHKNCHNDTPLILAAYVGNEKVCEALLEIGVVDPDHVGSHGDTALYWACKGNMPKLAGKLLERNLTHAGKYSGYGQMTTLMKAIENKMTDIALKITKMPFFDPDEDDYDGKTALIHAAETEQFDLVKELLKYNPDHFDVNDNTALIILCNTACDDDTILALIKVTKNIDHIGPNNLTALMIAIIKNREKVAIALFKTGLSNPHLKNSAGESAMTLLEKCDKNYMLELKALIKAKEEAKKVINEAPIKQTNDKSCCICLDTNENKVAIIPCGHTQICSNCVKLLDQCPICKSPKQSVIRIFL